MTRRSSEQQDELDTWRYDLSPKRHLDVDKTAVSGCLYITVGGARAGIAGS